MNYDIPAFALGNSSFAPQILRSSQCVTRISSTKRRAVTTSNVSLEDKPSEKRVAVIGAGWAGLGAAYHLSKIDGVSVTLIDAAPSVGGLVAGWKTRNGQDVEVGIHGMWRPYFNLFHLVKNELGLDPFTDWTKSSQRSPKGKVVESPIFNDMPRLPSPLGTFVYTKFLDLPLIDRLSALPLMEAVLQWDNSDEAWKRFDRMSAKELFQKYGCSERVYKEAFEPMLLVGLFAPGEQCSASGALGMLYFFILAHQADFDVVWPRGTVGKTIFAPLVQRIQDQGGVIRTSTRLKDVNVHGSAVTQIITTNADGCEKTEDVDAVIFSVGISGLQGILRSSKMLGSRRDFRNTNNLSSIDVMAVRLYFDRIVPIEFASNACFGFDASTGWTYFDLNAIHDEFKQAEYTVIEADFYHSNQLMPMDDAEIAEEVRQRLCIAESSFRGAKVEDFVVVRVPRGVTRTYPERKQFILVIFGPHSISSYYSACSSLTPSSLFHLCSRFILTIQTLDQVCYSVLRQPSVFCHVMTFSLSL